MTRNLISLAMLAFSAVSALAADRPVTPEQIRAHFGSPQYRQVQRPDEAFLRDVYRVVLGRKPDWAGYRDWLAALSKGAKPLSREQVLDGFLKSPEYKERAAKGILAAAPKTPKQLREFFDSPGYRGLDRSDEDFLKDVYRKVLGRASDANGFNSWLAALKNGAKGITRGQVVDRFLKSAEYRASAKPVATPPPTAPPPPGKDLTRNPGNVLFDGIGLFVEDGERCRPTGCGAANAAKLKAAGVTWIALQIHNNEEVEKNAAIQPTWVDQWRAAGFTVGFWGVSYGVGKAAGDGRTAARLTAKHRGQFYIANCENAFQRDPTDPASESRLAENRAFVDGFQAQASAEGIGSIPRALSSMGRIALDPKPWIDNGWDALPQAYWNDHLVYQPSHCAQFYRDWGWPAARIHPTLATYPPTGDQTRQLSLRDYAADMKAAKTKGFSFYIPENYLDEAQYQQLIELSSSGL